MTECDFDVQVALLLRPIPSTMARETDAIRIGGLPRLPDELDWPRQADERPIHFFAEIDLARLPRAHEGCSIPDLPKEGTLFVFAPMGDSGFHTDYEAQVLYWPGPVDDLPECKPPNGLPVVLDEDPAYMDPDGMTHDGTVLLRRHVEVLPFLSPRRVPFFHQMEGVSRGVELDRDAIDAKAEEALNAHRRNMTGAFRAARPLPEPEKADVEENPTASSMAIPHDFLYRIPGEETPSDLAPIDLAFVFDWAKAFYLHCLRLARTELLRKLDEAQKAGDNPTVWLDHLMENERLIERANGERRSRDIWLRDGAEGEPPLVTKPFDEQALGWMELASEAKGLLTPTQRGAFVAMLTEIHKQGHDKEGDFNDYWFLKTYGSFDDDDDEEEEDEPTRLDPSGIHALESCVPDTAVHAGTTLLAALDAYELAGRLELARETSPAIGFDASKAHAERWDERLLQANAKSMAAHDQFDAMFGSDPPQMFGMASGCQSEAEDHNLGDSVLLMQIGDAVGLPQDLSQGVVMHLWIAPEDLAAGRFERVETTVSMS